MIFGPASEDRGLNWYLRYSILMVELKCSDYATFLNFIALSKSYVACKFIQILADVFKASAKSKAELAKVFAQHNISAVIHLAGLAIVEESFEKSLEYLDQNVNGTQNVLEICKEFGVKDFIFSSSSTIYGDANEMQKLTEKHNSSALSPYGNSKIQSEQAIFKAAGECSLNYLILRYFNVAGASLDLTNGSRGKGAGRVVFNATKSAVHGAAFRIFGND